MEEPDIKIKSIDQKLKDLNIKSTMIFDIMGSQDCFICKLFLPDRTLEIREISYQQLLVSTDTVLNAIIKQGQTFIK